MAVTFNEKTGDNSAPEPLFEIDSLEQCFVYGLTEDGKFVMAIVQQGASPTHYQVVENWFEELKRLVPSGGK
jgi:hypothetical protein